MHAINAAFAGEKIEAPMNYSCFFLGEVVEQVPRKSYNNSSINYFTHD
jgi:hypothetical protein